MFVLSFCMLQWVCGFELQNVGDLGELGLSRFLEDTP